MKSIQKNTIIFALALVCFVPSMGICGSVTEALEVAVNGLKAAKQGSCITIQGNFYDDLVMINNELIANGDNSLAAALANTNMVCRVGNAIDSFTLQLNAVWSTRIENNRIEASRGGTALLGGNLNM